MLADFAYRRSLRAVTAPTNDSLVRKRLRELSQPISLFGERAPGRRERLQGILARLALESRGKPETADTSTTTNTTTDDQDDEHAGDSSQGERVSIPREAQRAYLTPGLAELRSPRLRMANWSLMRIRQRLARERQEKASGQAQNHRTKRHSRILAALHSYGNYSSTIGDVRPISSCQLNPSATRLATASWSGQCKIWEIPSAQHLLTLTGHEFYVTDIAFHPSSGSSQHSSNAVNLASAGMDGIVCLWPIQPNSHTEVTGTQAELAAVGAAAANADAGSAQLVSPLAKLYGHTERCCRLAFHPSGDFLASASFDRSWRLWDLNTQKEILAQPYVYIQD